VIACIGLGKMGAALAERLVADGHEVRGFDLAPAARQHLADAGGRSADSAAAACAGADTVLLCLPDASAVEAVAEEVLSAGAPLPGLWIDCTSSLPVVTRRVGRRLAEAGSVLVDAPVTGGVAGARDGALTAMVGGDREAQERARPVLACFAARVLPAGPLGAGHAVKAINNMLSSASLWATAEITAAAQAFGHPLAETVAHLNAGLARSQNSEVKFVRDVVPGRYASGFTVGLMAKDVATACTLSGEVALPLAALQRALWCVAVTELGPAQDFTRVFELADRWTPDKAPATTLDAARTSEALAGLLAVATAEALALIDALDLDRSAALAIINAGSGRNELTRLAAGDRDRPPGRAVGASLAALDELLSATAAAAPVARLGAELLRRAARDLGNDTDLAALVTT
jgi:3-hydroxyisobutyrate dehydrogenase